LNTTVFAPCSRQVGTPAKNSGRRSPADTAITRTLPAFMCGTHSPIDTGTTSTWPPSSAVMACAPELKVTLRVLRTSMPAAFNAIARP